MYLLQDDIPAFLRCWMDAYAGMAAANGKLWEHWHLGSYGDCDAPDTMTAGWFLENFRNLLVMEDGDSLWVGRGIPRAWLEGGRHVTVRDAPTYFGRVAFDITSEADARSITARIVLPTRRRPSSVLLRLRHPGSEPIKSATVNGRPWNHLDPAREAITLTGLTGEVTVTARY
jgi:hypothetical protein